MAALSLYVHILVEIIAASSKLYIKKDDYPMLNEGFGFHNMLDINISL
jgi:hypothetical protein